MATYYVDHLAAARKEVTSRNFCNLVDAAVMLYEEENRKGKSKFPKKTIMNLSKEKNYNKRKTLFVSRRNQQNNHQNLNGAFTSSSLFNLNMIPVDSDPRNHPSSTLLAVDSETTEMRTNPPKPTTLHEKRSRKRGAEQERKRSAVGESKKAKVEAFSWKGREPPECVTQLVKAMDGIEGPRLVFEKLLKKTDVQPCQSRLLMPFKTLVCNDFLKPVECRILEEDMKKKEKDGVGAILVDQRNVKWGLILVIRAMEKHSGKRTLNYALISGWNEIVEGNGLKKGDNISIWSFRWREVLCFALVLPPSDTARHSSSLALSL